MFITVVTTSCFGVTLRTRHHKRFGGEDGAYYSSVREGSELYVDGRNYARALIDTDVAVPARPRPAWFPDAGLSTRKAVWRGHSSHSVLPRCGNSKRVPHILFSRWVEIRIGALCTFCLCRLD